MRWTHPGQCRYETINWVTQSISDREGKLASREVKQVEAGDVRKRNGERTVDLRHKKW
jgi:hypothetical protein